MESLTTIILILITAVISAIGLAFVLTSLQEGEQKAASKAAWITLITFLVLIIPVFLAPQVKLAALAILAGLGIFLTIIFLEILIE